MPPIRLIEAADVLLATLIDQQDMMDLQAAKEYAKRRLRQIMAASEKVLGTVQDVGNN